MKKIESIGTMTDRKSKFTWKHSIKWLFVIALIVFSFRYFLIQEEKDRLQERAVTYFNNEEQKNWENTYYFRPPIFRKIISLKEYSEIMTTDSQGWDLISYRIEDVRLGKNTAKVFVSITHKAPKDFPKPSHLLDDQLVFRIATRWIKVDGEWYVEDAGVRLHLSYNRALVK